MAGHKQANDKRSVSGVEPYCPTAKTAKEGGALMPAENTNNSINEHKNSIRPENYHNKHLQNKV